MIRYILTVTLLIFTSHSLMAEEAKEGDRTMPLVTGIGGFFFRAADTEKLVRWYADNLDITPVPKSYEGTSWQQEAGTTVFAPFKQDTKYFGPDNDKQWMLNLRTRDLDALVARLRENGNEVEVDPETYPNGRFARVYDPEGNPIQLWQPEGPAPR